MSDLIYSFIFNYLSITFQLTTWMSPDDFNRPLETSHQCPPDSQAQQIQTVLAIPPLAPKSSTDVTQGNFITMLTSNGSFQSQPVC